MAPTALSIRIAEKRFGDGAPLYTGFRLDVAEGEVAVVLGPSGVGKSSLLRMIAGIDTNFDGTIEVGGIEAAERGAPGFVFQDPRLLPWLTVAQNLKLAQRQPNVDAVEILLGQVGLAGRGDDFPHQLSGGMQRRASLARALATRSRLLLLDEPFVSLDASLVDEMRTLLVRLVAERAMTVVLVSHSVEDAVRLASRVWVLEGRPVTISTNLRLDTPATDRSEALLAGYRARLAEATKKPVSR